MRSLVISSFCVLGVVGAAAFANADEVADWFGSVVIDGSVDEVQLTVAGHSTQTYDLVLVEKSDGTDLFNITNANGTSKSAVRLRMTRQPLVS